MNPFRLTTVLWLGLAVVAAPPPAAGQELPVTGAVVDDAGEPFPGAEVTLHPLASFAERGALLAAGAPYAPPVARVVTGGDGRFRLEAPEAGFWTLVARAEGHVPMELPLWPLIAPAEVEAAELLPDAGLRVRVLDEGGRPIPGAVVEVFGSGPPGGSGFREPAQWRPLSDRVAAADEQGLLRLPRFEGEEVSLRAVAPGRAAGEEVGEPPPRGAVRLVLAPGPTRRVRVVTPDGSPAPGAVVWFSSPLPAGVTGEDGTLEVPLQTEEPGEPTEVQVDSPDGLVAEAELRAPAGGEEEPGAPVTLRLEPPSTVSGRVIEEGTRDGAAGALVWPRRDPSAGVRADRTGSFRVAVRRPWDREVLQAAAPGFLEARSGLPSPGRREAEEVTLVLEPAVALRGTVVDAAGRAVAGAEVRVAPAERLARHRGGFPAFARSGRDGRFRVAGLARGAAHLVHVVRRGYAPAVEEVAPAPEGAPGSGRPAALPEIQVVLHEGRALRGRAVRQDGEPVAGARVTSLPEDVPWMPWRGTPPGRAEATTGADGAFEVAEVLAGRSTLHVQAAGHAPFRREGVEVPAGGGVTDLGELVLEPEAFVAGRVVDPEGDPVPGASVQSWRTSGSRMRRMYYPGSHEPSEPATTGEDGGFRVGGAAAGEVVRIEVGKEGWVEARVDGVRVPPEEPVTVLLRPAATVAGAVVDERGRPVPGAEVRPAWRAMAGPGGGHFRPQPADDRGAFELTGLSSGRVAIEARAPGYQTSAPVTLELAPGERREGVEIVLAEGAAVTGRVLGPDGLPVAGARVGARAEEAFGASWRGASVETGAEGRFTLDTLPPGRVVLEATKEGFASASREVELGPGGASVELHLGRGAEVSGWVIEADGSPAAGRQLQLAPGIMSFDYRSQETTAADGSFLFRGVADGEYRLKVLEDFSVLWSSPDPIRVEGGAPVSGLEVRLPATATLTGQLVGLRPDEVQGATIQAVLAERGLQGERSGEVLPDGGYRVSGLVPGRWQVVAAAVRSGRQAHGRVEIEAGRTEAVLDLEFRAGYAVTGTVLSAGEPLAGAHVRVQSMTWAGMGEATTGIDGRFRIEGVSAGRHRLTVQDPHSGTMAFEEVAVDGDRDVRVELESFRVRGAVYAADGSGPVGGAQVQLQRAPDGEQRTFFSHPSAVSGDDGSFLLTGVAGGSWRLLVEKAGYAAHASDVEVPGGDVEAAPVFLERAGSLEIVARLARGGAPSFLMVTILGPGDQVLGSSRASAVEPGRFVLSTVPAGTWELLLWTPEAPPQRVEVESPGAAEVVFPEPCVLEVTVPELAATGMAAHLTITDPAGRSPWASLGAGQAPLDQGRIEVPTLAPGTWVVTVTAEDGRTWSATATVAPGAPTRLVLE